MNLGKPRFSLRKYYEYFFFGPATDRWVTPLLPDKPRFCSLWGAGAVKVPYQNEVYPVRAG